MRTGRDAAIGPALPSLPRNRFPGWNVPSSIAAAAVMPVLASAAAVSGAGPSGPRATEGAVGPERRAFGRGA
ncbi:hypothetical protein [Nonomuraea sp. NPDC049709]|uniref:hypothetical protein n=1 Tax=Nonomuraea sp. NPDC049709 TaxID=3154736 RepID=UPI003423E5FC